MRTYRQLQTTMERLNYLFFTDEFNLNFVWERTNDDITNKFTDWLHIAFVRDGRQIVLSIPATTKPGLKGSIDSPVTVDGVTGTAIIIPGQYVNSWQFFDTEDLVKLSRLYPNKTSLKQHPFNYPHFRQIGLVDYWRDGDKDLVVDYVQKQDDKIYGTHWHVMSQIGTYGSGQVNNWSLGCMGAAEPEFKKILPVVRESVKLHGNKVTGTIIESKDFV